MYTIDDEKQFDTFTQLVEHYQKEADSLVTRLCVPVAKVGRQNYTVEMDNFKKCECIIAIHASFHLFYKNAVGRLQTDGILLVVLLPSSRAIGFICRGVSHPHLPPSPLFQGFHIH